MSRYEEFWAVRDVSLTVPHGCTYGLIGHNGSGKSTLLRVMAGIHRPTKGSVSIQGRVSALLELGAGLPPGAVGSRERLPQRGHPRALPSRHRRADRRDHRLLGARRLHRQPGQGVLERHVRPPRLLGRRARRPGDPDHRRGHRRRRRGLPAPLLRPPLQAPPAGRHDRGRVPQPRAHADPLRRGGVARPRPPPGGRPRARGRPVLRGAGQPGRGRSHRGAASRPTDLVSSRSWTSRAARSRSRSSEPRWSTPTGRPCPWP